MSLPITPAAITRRARSVLGQLGAHSRQVGDGIVEVFVGDVHQARAKSDEYGQRQRQLIDELTAQGYLAEPVGSFMVRVQRPEDVERKRRERAEYGAALAGLDIPVDESDVEVARPVPELVAEARAILAEIEPDAGDVAAVTEDLPEHLRGDLDLIRRLALSRGSAYAQGWNDGHTTGIAEADDVLVDVRQRVQALKAHLWEDGDPADAAPAAAETP